MKGIDSLKMLDGLDNELILSAEKLTKRRSPVRTVLPIAAGLCLVIGTALVLSKLFPREKRPDASALASETAPVQAETATDAPTAVPAAMLDLERYVCGGYNEDGIFELDPNGIVVVDAGPDSEEPTITFRKDFFIHEGRIYARFLSCGALADIIGKAVCEISPIDSEEMLDDVQPGISEGRPPQIDAAKYEGKGTMTCIMHEVKGCDPGFVLCMRDEGLGNIIIYTADLGLTGGPASGLFEDGLNLSGDISRLYYSFARQNEEEYLGFEELKYVFDASEHPEETASFIEALNEAEWVDDTRTQFSYSFIEGAADGFNDYPESYAVYVNVPLRNDLVLSLFVYSDGVVTFPYSYFDKALKLSPAKLAPFLELVESEAGTKLNLSPLDAQTIDACRADEHMGYLVPDFLPDGFIYRTAIAFYEYDSLTGAIVGTESIRIEYKNYSTDAVINLWILKPDSFERESAQFIGKGGAVVTLDELTLEDIVELNDRPSDPGAVVSLAAVTHGDHGICVEALGADAQTVYAILDSIRN